MLSAIRSSLSGDPAAHATGRDKNNGSSSRPTLIFLHIPKAAGSTFDAVLERKFKGKPILTIRKPVQEIEQLKGLPRADRERLQLIKGHFPYGIHEHLSQPFEYITILREPVERIISHYYFVLRRPDHYLYDAVTSQKIGLKEYVLGGLSPELDNGQARLIAGPGRRIPCGACSRELLEQAKQNLQHHFSIVGLAERFDETMLLVSRRFGWRPVCYVRQNVTDNRPRRDQFSPDIIEAIKAANWVDMELYAFAEELFQTALRERGGPFFKFRLARYKARNASYCEKQLNQSARHHARGGVSRT